MADEPTDYRVVVGPFRVPVGFAVTLTAEQAQPRAGSLQLREGTTYDVIAPIEFKVGEEITIVEGDPTRWGEPRLEVIEPLPEC